MASDIPLVYTLQAEEITLTIGQAFDLAYRRFLETTGRELEGRRQMNQLQEHVEVLERQNKILRGRLLELSGLVDPNKLTQFLESHGVASCLVLFVCFVYLFVCLFLSLFICLFVAC